MKIKSILLTVMLGISIIIQAQETKFNIEVKNTDAVKAVIIKAEVPTSQISQSMGEVYGKLYSYMGQKQVQPAGPPFAVYTKFEPQGNTAYEGGVPVSDKVEVTGEYVYMEYPAMKVVSLLYKGSYEGMLPAYEALEKYMKDNNLKEKGGPWEIYLTDPSTVAPEENKTIINFPVE